MVPRKKLRTTVFGRSSSLAVIHEAAASSVPVLTRAPDSTNMAAIVIGALLENTAVTSLVSMSPRTKKQATPAMATTAGGKRSSRNAPKVRARMTIAIAAWCCSMKIAN
jgi:hypothetical protein